MTKPKILGFHFCWKLFIIATHCTCLLCFQFSNKIWPIFDAFNRKFQINFDLCSTLYFCYIIMCTCTWVRGKARYHLRTQMIKGIIFSEFWYSLRKASVTRKNRQMSIKVAQKWFHWKNDRFWHLYKNWLRMWEIWAN